ncbi:MAG: pyridoxamine 5'-phosphate oxidase [Ignavibacteriaceae bacterium]|nr:pyridoxamine 5'-phosphate oxidase [Ignavibacteriaceae bacterium]
MQSKKFLKNLRQDYILNKLSEETVHKNPFEQFEKWFEEVLKVGLIEPNAMILATADDKAKPSVRVVLMKGLSKKGYTFFSNYNSRKGKNLSKNSSASLLFFWAELERQVRVEGKIKKISKVESQKYFNMRPLESRLAAWASEQSEVIPDRDYLENRFQKYKEQFKEKEIPMPKDWGGYILVPEYFEFWQGRENRLHDRICYKKVNKKWNIFRLAP